MEEPLASLSSFDPMQLCDAVARIGSQLRSPAQITVGVLADDRAVTAQWDGSGRCQPCGPDSRRLSIECVTKILAGTLALVCSRDGRFTLEDDVSELLDACGIPCARRFNGTSLRHLLGHSHGIDVSHLQRMPLTDIGRLDLDAVFGQHQPINRLFEPGTLYSYSNAGSWITTAWLEQAYSTRFADLLAEKVLRPAGLAMTCPRESSWCPAMGADFSMSVPDILQWLRWYLCQPDIRDHVELHAPVAPSGWCLDRGACAGWKLYGHGWYGHNMLLPDRSLVLRVQPQQKVALVVAATGPAAGLVTARLFGRILPEYLHLQIPKPLPRGCVGHDAAHCAGTYANRAMRVRVLPAEQATLEAQICDDLAADAADRRSIHIKLRPGTLNAYLAEPGGAAPFQWIQFLSPGVPEYSHLWDGRRVLRRTAV